MQGKDIRNLPLSEKFSLTVSETAAYFGIGSKKYGNWRKTMKGKESGQAFES